MLAQEESCRRVYITCLLQVNLLGCGGRAHLEIRSGPNIPADRGGNLSYG